MGLEHRAARRLGRMRGEDELDPSRAPAAWSSASSIPLRVELRERVGERLARHPSLGLVLAPAPDPVVLLGDVDELEEQRERPQHRALRARARAPRPRRASAPREPPRARVARERPDPLLVVEEVLALLLDEHAPEQVAEQAHVGAESGVGRHATAREAARPSEDAVELR